MSSYSHSTNKALNSNTNFFKDLDLFQVFQESERKTTNKKGQKKEKEKKRERQRTRKRKRGGFIRPYFQTKCDRIALH